MVKMWCRVLMSAAAILLCVQCRIAECEVVMTNVDVRSWTDDATITYQNNDTLKERNLAITLHINRQFAEQELTLEITTYTPDSLRYSEEVRLPIEEVWPNRTIDATDIELPYRQGVVLRHTGEYKITITPRQPLKGVVAAGVNFQSQK